MAFDATTFKGLFPEFSSSTYDARIAALLPMLPVLDEDKAGNQLNMAWGFWLADKLAMQDITIKYGAAGSMSSSSTSTEKKVGEVSIKTSLSQSASAGMHVAKTNYGVRYDDLIREFGYGAVAV